MIAPQGLNLQINKGTDFNQDLEMKNPDKTPCVCLGSLVKTWLVAVPGFAIILY